MEQVLSTPANFPAVLRGFFAGEGSVKFTKNHGNRVIRIAQKARNPVVEKMLRYIDVEFTFIPGHRTYEIYGRGNIEKLAGIRLANMHPDKHARMVSLLAGYRQRHLKRNTLKPEILLAISTPRKSSEIAEMFGKSISRAAQVLVSLKKEGKAQFFKVGSSGFWVRSDAKLIIISRRKSEYLNQLAAPKSTAHLARTMRVCPRAAKRRLNELERLGLVCNVGGRWNKMNNASDVLVL